MDINDIKERFEQRPNVFSELNYEQKDQIYALLTDLEACLNYIPIVDNDIKELEERLRWKKVEEAKPPMGKDVLVRITGGFVLILKLLKANDGELYWLGARIYPFSYGVEWREI